MRWASAHSLYTSREWAELKARLLLERGDICECGCGQRFMGSWDCIPHHVIELTDENVNDWDISLNPDNIRLVRHSCHNRIHERFGGGAYRKVYLVTGSPAAGKSSFVAVSARADDLVLDIDSLWDAICTGGSFVKPERMKGEAFALRDALLDRVRMRAGRWRCAWVIGTYPLVAERRRVLALLGAEELHIEVTKEEALGRCGEDERRIQWIEEYFASYQP